MRRYLRIIRVCIANSIQLDLEYRLSFVIQACTSVLGIAAGLAVVWALFEQGNTVAGWSFPEMLVLFGAFAIAQGTIDVLLLPSLGKISEQVKLGSMDYMLLKPVDLQFLVSVRSWNIWGVPDLVLGLGITLYGMAASGTLTAANLALFVLLMLCGVVVLYALASCVAVTAFWTVQAEGAIYILYTVIGAGRFPVNVYPAALRLFFTFVIPIAFITTVPASAATGRLDWPMAAGSVAVAAVSLGVSSLIWHLAARSYSSASS